MEVDIISKTRKDKFGPPNLSIGLERQTHKEFEYWKNTQLLPNTVDIPCLGGKQYTVNLNSIVRQVIFTIANRVRF